MEVIKPVKVEPIKAETAKNTTKTTVIKTTTKTVAPTINMTLLSDLHALRRRMELSESGLSQYLHIPLGDNSVQECSQRLLKVEVCVATSIES